MHASDLAPVSPPSAAFDRIVIPTGHGPGSIAVADLNHDHHPDLIVANSEDGTLSVLLGDGTDRFTSAPGSPFVCGPSPNDIAVADINGDGNLDLIVANTGTPYITVLLGDGRGRFAPSPHSPFATQSFPHVHGVGRRISSATASPLWSLTVGVTTRSSCSPGMAWAI
jgi:hypothetical protein